MEYDVQLLLLPLAGGGQMGRGEGREERRKNINNNIWCGVFFSSFFYFLHISPLFFSSLWLYVCGTLNLGSGFPKYMTGGRK